MSNDYARVGRLGYKKLIEMMRDFVCKCFVLMALSTFALASCSKDDDVAPGGNGEIVDPGKNVPDPAGTVTLNMMVGDDGKWVDIAGQGSVRINSAYNFEGAEFVSLGQMKGLGNVTTIPQEGWNRAMAATPGEGYVARAVGYDGSVYAYARFYVVSEIVGVTGGVIGYKVKCQSPFELPLRLEETDITFGAEDELVKELTFASATASTGVTVESCPDWCDVTVIQTGLRVTAMPNLTSKESVGSIVLKNSVSKVSVGVKQKGMNKAKFAAGRGTAESPWVISTPASLDEVRNYPSACYELGCDIDLSAYLGSNTNGWKPIDDFSGKFDGKKHTIKGLWISLSSMNKVGLFSSIKSAGSVISNLNVVLDNKGITGQNYVGILCGEGSGRIENCMATGDVVGQLYVGGLCGSYVYNVRLDIIQCATSGTVTAQNYMGGIVGQNYSETSVQNSYSTEYITVIPGWSESRVYGISCTGAEKCYYAGKIVAGEARTTYIYPVAEGCTGCYYNTDRNAYEWRDNRATGLTTSEMMKQSSFQGWDFDNVWTIEEGRSYPQLRSLQ